MNPLFVALLALGLITPAVAATPTTPSPIASKVELDRYLRDTPPGSSPLDQLSPDGRRRFLAELQFLPHGVAVSYGELVAELTQPQIVAIFALFGQPFPPGMGLTPEEKSRRDHEREADARARGCTLANCPETEIERRYGTLVTAKPDFTLPDVQRFAADTRRYDQLFAEYQTPDRLHKLSKPELRLLQRATSMALYAIADPAHTSQLRMDLDEMQRRGLIQDNDYEPLYLDLIATRQFPQAAALQQQHPGMQVDAVPILRQGPSLPSGWPTALTLDADGHGMTREAFDLSGPLRIVVVASCHFSQDAARAIENDRQLRPLFAQHAIWLASQGESFGSIADWNRQFADQSIHLAWQDSEWSMLDNWGMPTFYVYRNGGLQDKWSGWPAGSSALQTVRDHLRQAGALD